MTKSFCSQTVLGTAVSLAIVLPNASFASENEREAIQEEKLTCNTEKRTIIVDLLSSNEYRYRAWDKPKDTDQKPDMEIVGGEETLEGTGPCRHFQWLFQNDNVRYEVSTLGCTDVEPPEGTVGELSVYVDGEHRKTWWCVN